MNYQVFMDDTLGGSVTNLGNKNRIENTRDTSKGNRRSNLRRFNRTSN